MRILIARDGENIVTTKEYSGDLDRGEIAHIVCELEMIKLDLLEMWDEE